MTRFPGRNHAFGVCVRAERAPSGRYNVHLPIHDFSVPSPDQQDEVELALRETLEALLDGKPVYVGCMGGWGRTGLFLALLAKVCGVDQPVTYVRENYSNRAVETRSRSATSRTSTFPASSAGCSGKPGRSGCWTCCPSR